MLVGLVGFFEEVACLELGLLSLVVVVLALLRHFSDHAPAIAFVHDGGFGVLFYCCSVVSLNSDSFLVKPSQCQFSLGILPVSRLVVKLDGAFYILLHADSKEKTVGLLAKQGRNVGLWLEFFLLLIFFLLAFSFPLCSEHLFRLLSYDLVF